jgi:beta-glucosidase
VLRRSAAILIATAIACAALPAAAPATCTGGDWCNASLSVDTRADAALAQMTQAEKFALMATVGRAAEYQTVGVPRFGIPPLVLRNGPVGLRLTRNSPPPATALPAAISLASSFDPGLAEHYGSLVGVEASRRGVDGLLGPAIDIARTPQAGRTFESYGEDPLLTGAIGAAWIEGARSQGVISVAKHYAGNNQETNRFTIDARIDSRSLNEIYLPAWQRAVAAGTGGVMAAYNRVNGTFMTANAPLLLGVLRGQFGFRGLILSDSGATNDTVSTLNGGLDLEAPFAAFYTPGLLSGALSGGQVSQATIDDHVRNILRATFASGVVDRPPFPTDGQIDFGAGASFAAKVSTRGTVLLRNRHHALPIDPAELRIKPKRTKHGRRRPPQPIVAVFGPLADSYLAGGGSSAVPPAAEVTPLEGIQARIGGRARVLYSSGESLSAAAQLARQAKVAIVVGGSDASENRDLPCLTLSCQAPDSGNQDLLIKRVAAANHRTIVVLETGAPVVMPWLRRVEAVLEAWYPGESGGRAIARVLFGDADPGGRLPISFPRRRADTPTGADPSLYPGVDEIVNYGEGILVGYRWYDSAHIAPRFPFGYGLSYTHFRYSKLRLHRGPGPGVKVSVTVRNVGHRRGREIAQLYLGMPASAGEPPNLLRGFQAFDLGRGHARRISFDLDRDAFEHWDPATGSWRIAPGCYVVRVARSSRNIELQKGIEIGNARPSGACAGG